MVAGDRAQRLLRLRRHISDQQRRREPAARRAGDLLSGPRRLHRGRSHVWSAGAYAQDEWRLDPRLTLNYGLRYERINPFTEAEDRLNGFVPGQQSTVRPDAPVGLRVPRRRRHRHAASRTAPTPSCRASAWSGTRTEQAHGRCARATASSTISSRTAPARRRRWRSARMPCGAVQPVQRRRSEFPESVRRARPCPQPNTFVRPSTVFALDAAAKPPCVQNWNASVQRSLFERIWSRSATSAPPARNLPRNVEANPAVYGPGATAQNADRRRIYANCPADGGTCDFSTVAMLTNITRSQLPGGAGERVAPLRRRRRVQRLVLVVEDARLSVVDEPVRRRGQAARRRERPRAEPVRSGRRGRPVAVRRAPRLRRQRELEADGVAARAGGRARGLRRLAGERHRHAQLGDALHGLGFGQRRACRPTARRSPAFRRAAPIWSAIRTADRTPSTSGSADPPFNA